MSDWGRVNPPRDQNRSCVYPGPVKSTPRPQEANHAVEISAQSARSSGATIDFVPFRLVALQACTAYHSMLRTQKNFNRINKAAGLHSFISMLRTQKNFNRINKAASGQRFFATRNVPHGTDSCIVIGGGIAGASISLQLARRGVNVTLLEKNVLTAGATWHAAGPLPSLCRLHPTPFRLEWALPCPALAPLCRPS